MSRYLITGNAGLIGSNLADHILTNTDDEVYGIDDLSGGYAENVHPNTKFYHMNLNSDELSDVFSEIKPDYVFHLAAYAAEGLSPFIRCFNYENNLKCTANLINNWFLLLVWLCMVIVPHLFVKKCSLNQLIRTVLPNMLAKWIYKLRVSNTI